MIGVDRRKRKQEKETNMGAVIVLTILATLVCGGVYTAFSGKLDDGVSAIMLLCSAMVGACAFGGIWYLAVG